MTNMLSSRTQVCWWYPFQRTFG